MLMKLRIIWNVLRGKGVCYRLKFRGGFEWVDAQSDALITECVFLEGGVRQLPPHPERVYYEALDALRCKHSFTFMHNPGGGEFYRGDVRFQLHMQDYKEDYDRFVEWLRENELE